MHDTNEGAGAVSSERGETEGTHAAEMELPASLKQLGEDVSELFSQCAQLLGAESRLFVSTLLLIGVLMVVAGLMIVGALIFLGAALALVLIHQGGLNPSTAVVVVAFTFLAAATGILLWIRRLTRHLTFQHSRRLVAELTARKPTGVER